jgi:hypothetical protein
MIPLELFPKICPTAPGAAAPIVNQILSYVVWFLIIMFFAGVLVGIGSIIGGKMFGLGHSAKIGAISLVVVVVCAILYLVMPSVLESLLGSGCTGG